MKKILLPIFILFSFAHSSLLAQCPPSGITFTSQGQIDSFQINYPGCTEILDNVIIEENAPGTITNLDSLWQITMVEGRVWIGNNTALTSLTGLDNLQSIKSCLRIVANPSLTDLSGLGNLSSVGKCGFGAPNHLIFQYGLYISDNANLLSLDGLNNLKSVEGCVQIRDNASLMSLAGMENLSHVGVCIEQDNGFNQSRASLEISGNSSLTSLSGFTQLDTLDYVNIARNDALNSLEGLDNLAYVGGCLNIEGNDALTTLHGLESLAYVGAGYCLLNSSPIWAEYNISSLTIFNNSALTSLAGLDNLSKIRRLTLYGNDTLATLKGLENLTSVFHIKIRDNTSLISLSGLDNVNNTTIDTAIIKDNPALSICSVKSICDYLDNNGGATIFENAPGCNNEGEIEDACLVSSEEVGLSGRIFVFPNPVTDLLHFQLPETPTGPNEISLFDAQGKLVRLATLTNAGLFDVHDLPHGMYVLKVVDRQQVYIGKFVKQ